MKSKKTSGESTGASGKSASQKNRILVVDDHPIVCQALAQLINRQPTLQCCATASALADAKEKVVMHQPDMVLLDLQLGAGDGLEFIKSLKADFPILRILVVSTFDEAAYAEPALRAGALGYVMKEEMPEEVLKAMSTVLAGEIYLSPKMRVQAVRRMLETKPVSHGQPEGDLAALTDRELQVFKAIGASKTNKAI